jgi:adenylate kinase family enzyme
VTTDAPGAVERVLVIGGPGAGKSTLAARLGAALGLPVVHLDAHFWRPGWQESPRPEWAARVAELAAAERWVMDGHYAGTLAVRARLVVLRSAGDAERFVADASREAAGRAPYHV